MQRPIDNKRTRALVIEQHRHLLGRLPCGCILQPIPCDCHPSCCRCPVELAICGHAQDWNDDEQEAFDNGMAAFLLAVDPENYSDPPPPAERLPTPTQESRLVTYEARVEAGYSPFGLDLDATRVKIGESITNGRNGALIHQGVKGIEVVRRPSLPESPTFADVHKLRVA